METNKRVMMKQRLFNLCILLLLFLTLFSAGINASENNLNLLIGHWEGFVKLKETKLNLQVDFMVNKSLSATISLPDEGFMFLPLNNIKYDYPKVSFELIEDNSMNDIFEGTLEDGTITGRFSKGQLVGSFTLKLINPKPWDKESYFGSKRWRFPFTESAAFKEILRNRRSIPTNENELTAKFKNLLYQYSDFSEELPEDELLPTDYNLPDLSGVSISVDDAMKEIDFLFKLIKYGYGGYQFFGGDTKFQEAKGRVEHEILTDANEGKILLNQYLTIITNHLDFIQDGHFRIGGVNLCKKYQYYTSHKYTFVKDDQGFYLMRGNKKRYLISVDQQEPANFLKLSLNPSGEFVFKLGMVADSENNIMVLDLVFDDQSEEPIVLLKETADFTEGLAYKHYEIAGIPVIENRSLNLTPKNSENLRKFVSEAHLFKNNKVIILDLRSNTGGNSKFAAAWCRSFSVNHDVKGELLWGQLVTNTALKLSINLVESNDGQSIAQEMKASIQDLKSMSDAAFPGWIQPHLEKGQKITNRNYIVVLIDSYTASAGEMFINYLKQMKQVVFIGTNTAGALIAGDVGSCQLPYSKLPIYFGRSFSLGTDLQNRDGIGYFPDIWVNPNQALEYAVKFVKRYLL